MISKILDKYKSKEHIEHFKNRLLSKPVYFANRASIARRNVLLAIDSIFQDNCIECENCRKLKALCDITINFDNDLTVCTECQDNYYLYCAGCGKPIYCEDRESYSHNKELYCKDCYFKVIVPSTDDRIRFFKREVKDANSPSISRKMNIPY